MKKLFFLIAFGALFGVMIAQGQSGNASIYIKRPAFVGAAWIHYLEINGVYVGQVKGGDCYKIIVPPGTYVVNYYNGALMTLEAAKQLGPSFSIPRNLAPGEELFVQVKIKATGPSYEIETGGKGFSKYKEIDRALEQLKKTGADYVEMSGSGSTVFGVFTLRQQAIYSSNLLADSWNCVLAQTV